MSRVNRAEAAAPLAIIGIGCLFPRAGNAQAYWLNIKNGVDGIGPVPSSHWNPDDYLNNDPKSPDRTYVARGGFLDAVDFRPLDFGIAPNDLEATDTSQLLGLVAARQALLDAGYGPDRAFDRNRVSVILGVTGTLELVIPLGARLGHPRWKKALANAGVSEAVARQVMDEIGDSYVGWQENSFPGLLGNVVAGRIANRLDLGGTNCVVDAACASSLSAIHLAGLELATGRCDVAVSGGVDTFNDIFMFMCFSKTPALSPTGDAKPFDAKGDGTILGEGLGIVVLKRLADAERDGDRVYAVIRGLGSSSDGKGNAIYAPVAAGQMKALRNAYEAAAISPDSVEMVEGHGTGTRVGDGVEVTALTEVYREARPDGTWCALGSVKSQIGHTKAAAGAAGLIKAALALHHKVLPPTIKVREPIDALKTGQSPFYLNMEKRPWIGRPDHPRRAAVSAFGFGGSNFHCVLEEHRPRKDVIDWDGDAEIIAVSGPRREALEHDLESWQRPRAWGETQCDAAASRQQFSTTHECRLLLVVNRDTDLARLAEGARAKLRAEPANSSWRLPEGAYFGAGSPSGKLAVLFPGQGSQYAGMLRDLACAFPDMHEVLEHANRVFARMTEGNEADRLSDFIYPFSVFTKAQRDEQEQRLRRTEVAQPAIGAVALGALKVCERFGVQPDAYAGHSYGELPALCAAGCFDEEALHAISRLRGHLMASYHGGDAGCMLAVHAPLHTIEAVLSEETLELVVANRNAPMQSVLSGRRAEIDRAAACLERRGHRHTLLPVAAAFHSPLVATAREPFHDALRQVDFQSARRPVFANTSGQAYPAEPPAIRELLAGQLANPVEFVREIDCMAEGGVRTFLEVGPGSTLTKLVHSILTAPELAGRISGWDAFALDASSGKRSGVLDLAHALARLAARGHTVELKDWQGGTKAKTADEKPAKPGLVVPICGANYVAPKAKKPSRPRSAAPAPASLTPPTTTKTAPQPSPSKPASTPAATQSMAHQTVSQPAAPAALGPESLAQALQATQQSLTAFQQLQEQTAQLHRQFLENQEAAQRTLQMLLEQQQALLLGGARPAALAQAAKPAPAPVGRNGDSHQNAQRDHSAPPLSKGGYGGNYPPTPFERGGEDIASAIIQNPSPTGRERAQPAPPPSVAAPAASASKGTPNIAGVLLAVVAEKTGYPAEMLAPEMALDADLGIDSIKRVEIFSALQERLPDAPVVKPEHLGTLQTLRDVIAFLSPNGAAAENKREVGAPPAPPADQISSILLQVVSEKTGYPAEMLAPEMALDADLGIDSIKRVEIFSALQERLPDAPVVKPEHLGTLHSLGDVVAFLSGPNGSIAPPEAAKKKLVPTAAEEPPAATAIIERSVLRAVPLAHGWSERTIALPSGSKIVLVADESAAATALRNAIGRSGLVVQRLWWNEAPETHDVSAAAALILMAPASPTDALPLRALRWLRRFGPKLREAADRGEAILAAIIQLDGAFGLGNLAADRDVVAGALAGLVKTAAYEWPGVACKAIDLAPDFPAERMGEVWEEATRVGPVEVGISARGRVALELKQEALPEGARPIASSDVVLITGGARGVTSAVATTIAERFQPTLVLFGRTSLDVAEPSWLAGCDTEAAIKQALARHLKPAPAPKALEAEYRTIAARRESLANIQRMKDAGARVYYRALSVADGTAVAAALAEFRATIGPVTHVIHGAGVLADRRIEDVTDEQFNQVFATKVAGIEAFLQALAPESLKALVLFSSSTGRFGRTGQIAYAAANEALNKIAQRQQRLWPACKVVAINWGPWDGGMVTGALRAIFENEGVGVIPLRQGAEALLRELAADKSAVEVTIIARPDAAEHAAPSTALHLAFEQEISLDAYPILRAHVIGGRPVLPLALHLELLAHAALHGNPGLIFHGVNEMRLLNGVQLDGDAPIRAKALAGKMVKRDGMYAVPVELVGKRGERNVVYSRAEVLLTSSLPAAAKAPALPPLSPFPHSVDDAYQSILFHGPELAGIERIDGFSDTAIACTCRTAPAPAAWLRQPLRGDWIAEPQAIDVAFQLMILWSQANRGAVCLPSFVGSYRQFRRRFADGPIGVQARIKQSAGAIVRADIDFVDTAGEIVATIRDHESVIDGNLERAFRNNRLAELVGGGEASTKVVPGNGFQANGLEQTSPGQAQRRPG
jgi:acyl transferase domain-containing protein/NADP-dependent 3-hydroxy acid dehydrogenase YdfG